MYSTQHHIWPPICYGWSENFSSEISGKLQKIATSNVIFSQTADCIAAKSCMTIKKIKPNVIFQKLCSFYQHFKPNTLIHWRSLTLLLPGAFMFHKYILFDFTIKLCVIDGCLCILVVNCFFGNVDLSLLTLVPYYIDPWPRLCCVTVDLHQACIPIFVSNISFMHFHGSLIIFLPLSTTLTGQEFFLYHFASQLKLLPHFIVSLPVIRQVYGFRV